MMGGGEYWKGIGRRRGGAEDEKDEQADSSSHSDSQSTVRLRLLLGLWKITPNFSVNSHVNV